MIEDCVSCGLCETRNKTVPGSGAAKARFVIVGEGPGEQEDLQGFPFVGKAGALLNEGLGKAGLSREEVFVTNVVKCRPPGNRNPTLDEMKACERFLRQQLEILHPELILVLGKVAAEFLLKRPVKITKENGHLDFMEDGTLVMIVLHPAYVLRNQAEKVRESFFEAFREAKFITGER